jgi:hypothetical protein
MSTWPINDFILYAKFQPSTKNIITAPSHQGKITWNKSCKSSWPPATIFGKPALKTHLNHATDPNEFFLRRVSLQIVLNHACRVYVNCGCSRCLGSLEGWMHAAKSIGPSTICEWKNAVSGGMSNLDDQLCSQTQHESVQFVFFFQRSTNLVIFKIGFFYWS